MLTALRPGGSMKRRVFVGSLAAMATILPFRRAHARLQQAFDRAASDKLALYANLTAWRYPPYVRDKSAYPVILERWRSSMDELRAAQAGLALAQRERLHLIIQMTPPYGFFGLVYLCEIEKARRDMPYLACIRSSTASFSSRETVRNLPPVHCERIWQSSQTSLLT
jgi:hypothetical protein